MSRTFVAQTTAATLVLALGAALTFAHVRAQAQDADKKKCYGAAMKGKNDCAAYPGTSCAGTSMRDHQGKAWKFAPKSSCEKTASATSPNGMGQLKEFKEKKA